MSGPASTCGNEGSPSLLFRMRKKPYSSSPGETRVYKPYSSMHTLLHLPTGSHPSVSSCGICRDRLRLTGTIPRVPFRQVSDIGD